MRAKCKRCGDTVEVTRPREYKSCKCGAIALDYGDGYYYRVCGDPEDFNGEIEEVPKIHTGDIVIEHLHPEQTITTYHPDTAIEPVKPSEICNLSSISYNPEFTKVDNFWAEMAGHFKAIAKLCEEKSEKNTSN